MVRNKCWREEERNGGVFGLEGTCWLLRCYFINTILSDLSIFSNLKTGSVKSCGSSFIGK